MLKADYLKPKDRENYLLNSEIDEVGNDYMEEENAEPGAGAVAPVTASIPEPAAGDTAPGTDSVAQREATSVAHRVDSIRGPETVTLAFKAKSFQRKSQP